MESRCCFEKFVDMQEGIIIFGAGFYGKEMAEI